MDSHSLHTQGAFIDVCDAIITTYGRVVERACLIDAQITTCRLSHKTHTQFTVMHHKSSSRCLFWVSVHKWTYPAVESWFILCTWKNVYCRITLFAIIMLLIANDTHQCLKIIITAIFFFIPMEVTYPQRGWRRGSSGPLLFQSWYLNEGTLDFKRVICICKFRQRAFT